MKKFTIYQVDAFAKEVFAGNPAAVLPLEEWPDDLLMQKIAMENNLAETAFFIPSSSENNEYDIRWFTPESEIDLCGHATLASAFVLYNYLDFDKPKITFHSQSGPLIISKKDKLIFLDFPSWPPERLETWPEEITRSLGEPEIVGVYKNRDYIIELANEDMVKKCSPDFTLMKKTKDNLIITAPGKEVDFVSRFFAPYLGIDEDPVTGSSHSQLIPFWSYKLGKDKMLARQLSKRGGELICEQKGERVSMGGECKFYMKGQIEI